MKKNEYIFSLVRLIVDNIIIFLALSYLQNLLFVNFGINQSNQQLSIILATFFVIFYYNRLYYIKISDSKISEIIKIFLCTVYVFLIYSVALLYGKNINLLSSGSSLRFVLIFFISIPFLLSIGRIIINKLQFFLISKGIIDKNNLLIIANSIDKEILEDIVKSKIYNIVGYINLNDSGIKELKYLGNDYKIDSLLVSKKISEIIYINSDFNDREQSKIYEISRFLGIRFRYNTEVFEVSKINTELSLLNKISLISIRNEGLDTKGSFIKRCFDIVFSLFFLVLFSPIILIAYISLLVYKGKNPVITTKSVGRHGKYINIYSFNIKSTEGFLNFVKNLPKLFNVFIGNMSTIGYEMIDADEKENIKNYELRAFNIKPGIFLIRDSLYTTLHINDKIRMNLLYIEKWSLIYDFKILLKNILS